MPSRHEGMTALNGTKHSSICEDLGTPNKKLFIQDATLAPTIRCSLHLSCASGKKSEGAADFYMDLFGGDPATKLCFNATSPYPNFVCMTVEPIQLVHFNLGEHPCEIFLDPRQRRPVIVHLKIECGTQDEVDRFWSILVRGGSPRPHGEVVDKFGVRWQVVPRCLDWMRRTGTKGQRMRVNTELHSMTRIVISTLWDAWTYGNELCPASHHSTGSRSATEKRGSATNGMNGENRAETFPSRAKANVKQATLARAMPDLPKVKGKQDTITRSLPALLKAKDKQSAIARSVPGIDLDEVANMPRVSGPRGTQSTEIWSSTMLQPPLGDYKVRKRAYSDTPLIGHRSKVRIPDGELSDSTEP